MTCPNCGHEVPRGPFCVSCGEPLENAGSPYPHEHRGYAAAPHERWFAPHIVSTLFPHLPRAHMWSFRIALASGSTAIIALCAAGLFPLALVIAAILVPFVSAVYLWDVDLYEDEPLPVLVATAAWGTIVGVGLGFAARHLTSPPRLLEPGPPVHDVIWLGVVLPAIGAVLALTGPLALLPYRRFNDVLDGATFGGIAAVFMLGAEVVTNSWNFLGGGLSAPGEATLWVPRLLMLAVAVPVAGAGFVGAATGAFWLRFRAGAADRRRLGPLGTPAVAVALAVAALVAVEIIVFYVGPWPELAVAAAVASAGLVLLRRTLHLGLQEEAAETEVGKHVRCPNCARETPRHRFCTECGVSLRAVPKAGARSGVGSSLGDARLRRGAAVAAVGAAVVAVSGITVLVIILVRPSPARPACVPLQPCAAQGSPTQAPAPSALRATAGGHLVSWFGAAGPGLYYNKRDWHIDASDSGYLQLHEGFNLRSGGTLKVYAAMQTWSSSAATAAQAFQATHDALQSNSLGMKTDTSQKHAVLGAEVGYVGASVGVYSVTLNIPPSPSHAYHVVIESAGNSDATVSAVGYTDEREQLAKNHAFAPFDLLGDVDALFDQFRWHR